MLEVCRAFGNIYLQKKKKRKEKDRNNHKVKGASFQFF